MLTATVTPGAPAFCHSREGGNPELPTPQLDARLRGHDKSGQISETHQ